MTALVLKLNRASGFQIRGLFATIFAVELREAVARTQHDEGAFRWGL
jgi:hypothetical protein